MERLADDGRRLVRGRLLPRHERVRAARRGAQHRCRRQECRARPRRHPRRSTPPPFHPPLSPPPSLPPLQAHLDLAPAPAPACGSSAPPLPFRPHPPACAQQQQRRRGRPPALFFFLGGGWGWCKGRGWGLIVERRERAPRTGSAELRPSAPQPTAPAAAWNRSSTPSTPPPAGPQRGTPTAWCVLTAGRPQGLGFMVRVYSRSAPPPLPRAPRHRTRVYSFFIRSSI